MEKILRGLLNLFRIIYLKIRCGKKVEIYPIQPMRIISQFMIQKNIKKVQIGKNFKLETNAKVRVVDGGELIIGDNFFMNCGAYITVMGFTKIGNNCLIGPNVMIFDHDHDYLSDDGVSTGNVIKGEVIIGDNVWIGANCCILRGAKIEDNSVIAAGSIVKGNIPSNVLFYQKRKNIIREKGYTK